MKYTIEVTWEEDGMTIGMVSEVEEPNEVKLRARVRRLQKRYPKAEITWREA